MTLIVAPFAHDQNRVGQILFSQCRASVQRVIRYVIVVLIPLQRLLKQFFLNSPLAASGALFLFKGRYCFNAE
ncbi:hypothetical protein [Pseudomonas sp. P108]|uniref:hypothetical protein n=1 Tax=Pseudomonas sp. P108 TaxID=1837993 RepID=UPI0029344F82|nr:hypothetical protein [Pseudomonas sp. P108]WNZ87401.1 hypothetical protein QOM10_31095 [Pseudomonas sp. P108]